jgi:hypothetical protein
MRSAGAENAHETTDTTMSPLDPGRPTSVNGRRRRFRWIRPTPAIAAVAAIVLLATAAVVYQNWSAKSDSCTGSNCVDSAADEAAAATQPNAGDSLPSAPPSVSASASASVSPSASGNSSTGPKAGPAAPGGFPGAGNTGVPPGKALKASGSVRVTKAGTVLDGLDVRGDISVEANNVTIKNTRLTNVGEWGIIQRQGASGLTIIDSEVRGNGKDKLQFAVINQGGMITIQRNEFAVLSDHISTSSGLIADNYIHSPKYFPGDHIDGIQSNSGPGGGQTLIIRHNTIIIDYDQTACIALFQDFGLQHSAVIENNLLAGGGYSIYGGAGKYGKSHNIRVINNKFSRQVYPKGGNFGPVAYWDRDGSGNVWQGNTWLDTGQPVEP